MRPGFDRHDRARPPPASSVCGLVRPAAASPAEALLPLATRGRGETPLSLACHVHGSGSRLPTTEPMASSASVAMP
jgi:hypothetical protein